MKLGELLNKLRELEQAQEGNTYLEVFYRHGASGDCGPIGNPFITSEVDDMGPFDLDSGQQYVSLYVGN